MSQLPSPDEGLVYTIYKTVNTHGHIRYKINNDDWYSSLDDILFALFIIFPMNGFKLHCKRSKDRNLNKKLSLMNR